MSEDTESDVFSAANIDRYDAENEPCLYSYCIACGERLIADEREDGYCEDCWYMEAGQ